MEKLKQNDPRNMKDLAARNYFRSEEPFADLFNGFLHQGKEVIKKEDLKPLDVTEIIKKEGGLKERRRDVVKLLAVKTDGVKTYMILGLECQSKEDWRMAIRMMLYDAMRYDEQINARASREEMMPVISAVVNLSGKRWRGPKSVREIFKGIEKGLWKYISDYRMNVIDPSAMSEAELMRYKSDLRTLMIMMKYSRNEKKMQHLIQEGRWMSGISKQGRIFTNAYFGIEMEEEKEEKSDMKNALLSVIKKEAQALAKIEAKEMAAEMASEMANEIAEKIAESKAKKKIQETARKMAKLGIEDELIFKCCEITKREMDQIRQEII